MPKYQRSLLFTMTLKYLFAVGFTDGTTYFQNPDDTPQIAESGSAFADVKLKMDEIAWFSLYQPNPTGTFNENWETQTVLSVNLLLGIFQFGNAGHIFTTEDPTRRLAQDAKFKLIFFRRHTHRLNVNNEELSHTIEYVLGYQTTDSTETGYQQVIAIT